MRGLKPCVLVSLCLIAAAHADIRVNVVERVLADLEVQDQLHTDEAELGSEEGGGAKTVRTNRRKQAPERELSGDQGAAKPGRSGVGCRVGVGQGWSVRVSIRWLI